jgi:NitT/TauT family transport system permease protein
MRYLQPLEAIPRSLFLGTMAASVGGLMAIWCLFSYGGIVNRMFLPTPGDVWQTTLDMLGDGSLATHTLASVKIILIGWAFGALLAVPLGIAMGGFKLIEAVLEPPVDFIRYLPVSALIPLLILYVGIGDTARITVIFIGTFFALILMVAGVVAQIPRELLESAYTLGASRWHTVTRVLLPAAMPGIMDNLRLTIGFAWSYLVVAEIVAAEEGLGYMILDSMRGLVVSRMYVGLLVIGTLGFLTDQFFRWLRKRLLPWVPD